MIRRLISWTRDSATYVAASPGRLALVGGAFVVGLVASVLRGALVAVASSVWHRLARVRVTLRFVGENRVETSVESRVLGVKQSGSVTFDRNKAFATVSYGGWELTRRDDAK